MKSTKVLSLVMSLCILGTSSIALSSNVKAADTKSAKETINDQIRVESSSRARIAGVVTITSTSGANVRSGPGTNYSRIGTANYGAELSYAYESRNGWYKVAYGGGYGWVSSSIARLG